MGLCCSKIATVPNAIQKSSLNSQGAEDISEREFERIKNNFYSSKIFGDDEVLNEKLSQDIKSLKDKADLALQEVDLEKKSSVDEFIKSFLDEARTNFKPLVESFEKRNKAYKPIIKLLEVVDLMLENFRGNQHKVHFNEVVVNFKAMFTKWPLGSDFRALRKIYDLSERFIFKVEPPSIADKFIEILNKAKHSSLWIKETLAILEGRQIIETLLKLSAYNKALFTQCLKKGRFDKRDLKEVGLKGSLIIGDEGGLFLLLNSAVLASTEENIILSSMTRDFLDEKRNTEGKIVLGEGAFGKVRLALSILGNHQVDFGQLVCIKKTRYIGEVPPKKKMPITLSKITDSTLEDFFAKKFSESIHAPSPIDMAIINNSSVVEKHRKAYLVMEIFPENTADKVFENTAYQKWEYQKPYILELLNIMQDLLYKGRVYNSDLKPQNTLFDPFSRKMAIIDLGSSLYVEKDLKIEDYDTSVGGFGVTSPYCPPEILDENQNSSVNLYKALSYLCGVTIAELISDIGKKNVLGSWQIGTKTDLQEEDLSILKELIKNLTEKIPDERIHLTQAQKIVSDIGSNEYLKTAMYSNYIGKLNKVIKTDPSLFSLNKDLYEIKNKGVLPQKLVVSNPKISKKQKVVGLSEELESFFNEPEPCSVFVLFGEAGSGKSLAIQLKFIEELELWETGKPLPIYFNMADDIDLERIIRRINENLGSNVKLEGEHDDIHLFVDSYDEGADLRARESKEGKNIILNGYVELLKCFKVKKILVSCRTDFIIGPEGQEDLSHFKITAAIESKASMRYRFIAPINYCNDKENENKNNQVLEELVENWLRGENLLEKKEECLKSIRQLGLEDKMNSGLMFTMIMKLLNRNQLDLNKFSNQRYYLTRFEIYELTISALFEENLKAELNGNESESRLQERKELIKNDAIKYFIKDYSKEANKQEYIFEGLEALGEKLATMMIIKDKNRISLHELEALLSNIEDKGGFHDEIRNEWKTLYHILRIMGLKLEKKKNKDHNEEISIGFIHETYKNYFLLNGLKRVLLKGSSEPNEDLLLKAIFEEENNLRNFELLRFFGEEIRNDQILKAKLRETLEREKKTSKNTKNRKKSRSPLIMSLLVSGNYQFYKEDLSFLDLSGSYLRGAMLFGSKFENSDLRGVVLRHTNLNQAQIIGSDIRGVDIGVWPKLIGHSKEVYCASWSPDSVFIASGSDDKTIKIWNNASGECVKTFGLPSGNAKSVAWDKDGKRIASGGLGNNISVWDFESGECLKTLSEHTNIINALSWTTDGTKLASAGWDNTIKVWDTNNWTCEKSLTGHWLIINSVSWDSEGKRLASGAQDKTLRLWDYETGACLKTISNGDHTVWCVAWSPDGSKVAGGCGDNTIIIWNTLNNELEKKLEGHSEPVKAVSWSPDGKTIGSGSKDESIKLWDSLSGECLQTLIGHEGCVNSINFSKDGKRFVSASYDTTIRTWDSLVGECVQNYSGHSDYILSLFWNKDGSKIMTSGLDNQVKIWDSRTGECLKTLKSHNKNSISCVIWSKDEAKVACAGYEISIWDIDSGELKNLKKIGDKNSFSDICWSPDEKIIASVSGTEKIITIWDWVNESVLKTLKGHNSAISHIKASGDGKYFATSSGDKTVKIWNWANFECERTLTGHDGRVNGLSWRYDSKMIATGSDDNSVKIWDVMSCECMFTFSGHENTVWNVSYSPDGSQVVSGSRDNTLRVWNLDKTQLSSQVLEGHSDAVLNVCWGPDGKTIASSSADRSIKIWEKVTHSKWILKIQMKGVEDSFSCVGSELISCIIDNKEPSDLRTKIVITQEGGSFKEKRELR